MDVARGPLLTGDLWTHMRKTTSRSAREAIWRHIRRETTRTGQRPLAELLAASRGVTR